MDFSPADLNLSKSTVVIRNMFSRLAKNYDLANRIMSLGRDLFWRKALAKRIKILSSPGRILDLASGTGDQIVEAKKIRPNLEVVGLDISAAMLELAEKKFNALPCPKPATLIGDARDLPFSPNSFDSVSIAFGLRNISFRSKLYDEVFRVLKPGGRFLILEMSNRPDSFIGGIVRLYLRTVIPWLGGRLIAQDHDSYKYLASSIMAFPPPEQIANELNIIGFQAIEMKKYTFNTVMLVWGEKPLNDSPPAIITNKETADE